MKGKGNASAFAKHLKDERQTEPAGQKQFSHMETPKVSESKNQNFAKAATESKL